MEWNGLRKKKLLSCWGLASTGDQPEDAPAIENPPPPVNPPIQPIAYSFWSASGLKTNQPRNRWEHFSMQWAIVRMTSSKRSNRFLWRSQNSPQWLFCSPPKKTKPRRIREHLYSRLIPPRRKLWVRNSKGWTYRRLNYCWSPRWYTVRPPTS